MPAMQQGVESYDLTDKVPRLGKSKLVDILGIGFGPSNLSLAIAIEESNQKKSGKEKLTAQFLEAKSEFSWHKGMLLPNATMQISFLKDLVSLRTPTSPYSFVSYLHEKQRLVDFVNLKTFFPSRKEYHDYLVWAAKRISIPVSYGVAARHIDWQSGCFTVKTFLTGDEDAAGMIFARNIVIGMGYQPVLPEGVLPSARVFHNHNLLSSIAALPSRPSRRFLVVGAGQSAAEVIAYLHETYSDAEIHASLRRFGYSMADDTPYVNRIFNPASVDEFYTAPAELKKQLLAYHWPANYSAVDSDLINELYRREYSELIDKSRRLYIHKTTSVSQIEEDADGVNIVISDIGGRHSQKIRVDALIFATGFRPFDMRDMLGPSINADIAFDENQPIVNRDYSLPLPDISGKIHLNGSVEHSHGLTSTLLSNVAMRAADILDAIYANTQHDTFE